MNPSLLLTVTEDELISLTVPSCSAMVMYALPCSTTYSACTAAESPPPIPAGSEVAGTALARHAAAGETIRARNRGAARGEALAAGPRRPPAAAGCAVPSAAAELEVRA